MLDDLSTPILNPRRTPRFAIRCQVRAVLEGLTIRSETEDLCLHGCQFVAPAPLARGVPARLVLTSPRLAEPLRVGATVAWSGPHAPWRTGVTFSAGHLEVVARWLTRLTTLEPEFTAGQRAPGQIEPAARLYLGEPPRYLLDFTSAELAVLRQVQDGVTAGELRRRLAAAWEPAARALFSLLARRAVTLEPAGAVSASTWTAPLVAAVEPDRADRPAVLGRIKLRPAQPPGDG